MDCVAEGAAEKEGAAAEMGAFGGESHGGGGVGAEGVTEGNGRCEGAVLADVVGGEGADVEAGGGADGVKAG